jgi:hypothetical protein
MTEALGVQEGAREMWSRPAVRDCIDFFPRLTFAPCESMGRQTGCTHERGASGIPERDAGRADCEDRGWLKAEWKMTETGARVSSTGALAKGSNSCRMKSRTGNG